MFCRLIFKLCKLVMQILNGYTGLNSKADSKPCIRPGPPNRQYLPGLQILKNVGKLLQLVLKIAENGPHL